MDMRIQFCLEAPAAFAGPADPIDSMDRRSGAHPGIMLRDFLASNYSRLHRRLLRHLGCADQASDCLHDAWLRLGDITVAETVQSPEAYVFRVACNVAIDRMRSNRQQQYSADAEIELEQFPDCTPGPELIAEARSDLAAVEHAMQRLPRRHLAILIALRIDQLTRDEVSVRYGLSLRSVDTALRQALDYCARQTNQPALAGVRGTRRALPQA
jgi:RNA polymerase sigma factor (sigma-70 family)